MTPSAAIFVIYQMLFIIWKYYHLGMPEKFNLI